MISMHFLASCSHQSSSSRITDRLPVLLDGTDGWSVRQAPNRPAPRFTGTAIPDPPCQRERWTPPETKLPRFLVNATAALFDAGMADPRGCDYREVELGETSVIKTPGLPVTA
jgi:hypothetical protein